MAEAELVLTINDLSRGGAGVARDDSGRVVFVPLTAPGDRVRVRIVETEKRFAQGELVEILQKSSSRVEPRCPVFGRCGGCQWQHLPYPLQWQTKVSGIKHALSRVSIPIPDQFDEFPAVSPWEYRNRIQMRGAIGPNGEAQLGFFARRSHDLVPIESCPVSRPELNGELPRFKREATQRLSEIRRGFKLEIGVLPNGKITESWNAPHGAAGFRQVNDTQNQQLKRWLSEVITPGRPLFDLFGGAGNLSLDLAQQMTSVDCVDSSSPITPEEFLQRTGLTQLPREYRFHKQSSLVWLMKRPTGATQSPVTAIVDPPREGLGADITDILAAFERLGVDELVAVGCDPDSWARDLSRMVRHHWKLVRAGCLDFFPQTSHVESVALLRR